MEDVFDPQKSIITNKGLEKYIDEKDFEVLIVGKEKKVGELISWGFKTQTYAILTEDGGKIILIPGKTRVAIPPSKKAKYNGRKVKFYYNYVESLEA